MVGFSRALMNRWVSFSDVVADYYPYGLSLDVCYGCASIQSYIACSPGIKQNIYLRAIFDQKKSPVGRTKRENLTGDGSDLRYRI